MFKKRSFWLVSGAIASVSLLFLLKSKQSSALSKEAKEDSKEEINQEIDILPPKVKSLNLIGDSQTKRHLGNAYRDVFGDFGIPVNFFGKEGATHSVYLKDRNLLSEIKALGCADVIVIQLGDNGVSAKAQDVLDFVSFVKTQCPTAQLYWAGPMKAVSPSITSSYVNTTDTSSPRYLSTYNDTRKIWDNRLKDALSQTDVQYISNFDLQESQPLNSKFNDRRKGDGIHLTKDSAYALASLMRAEILGK